LSCLTANVERYNSWQCLVQAVKHLPLAHAAAVTGQ